MNDTADTLWNLTSTESTPTLKAASLVLVGYNPSFIPTYFLTTRQYQRPHNHICSKSSSEMASNAPPSSRFTSHGSTAQDLLASQTVGLVNLSDFRKRRADALEQNQREAGSFGRFTPGHSAGPSSGTATPQNNDERCVKENPKPWQESWMGLIVKGQCWNANRTTQEEAKSDCERKAILRGRRR